MTTSSYYQILASVAVVATATFAIIFLTAGTTTGSISILSLRGNSVQEDQESRQLQVAPLDIDPKTVVLKSDQSPEFPFHFTPISNNLPATQEGEYIFQRTISSTQEKSDAVLFITTHFSNQHKHHLTYCWPEALSHSALLRNSDVMVYLTPPDIERTMDILNFLNNLFINHRLTVHVRHNEEYQTGAMMALAHATEYNWFEGYEWAIRINPDVIIRDDTFLLHTMSTDQNATAILINCCERRKVAEVCAHTDFFAVKPKALPSGAFMNPSIDNAELAFTEDIKVILERGDQRWVDAASPANVACRAGSGKEIEDTPIIHRHFNFGSGKCPIPFS